MLAKYLLKEEGWREAAEVLRERPFTLELAFKETANAIWKRATLLGDIDPSTAMMLARDLLKLKRAVRVEPQEDYLVEAIKIALASRLAVYDALFIAQAKIKNGKLVTADTNQYQVASSLGLEAVLLE